MIRKFVPMFFSAAVLSLLFLIFWQKNPTPRFTDPGHQMEVDMNIQDFSLVQGQEGKTSWELISDNAGFLKDNDVFVLDNPVITYHSRNNSGTMVVRASQGMAIQKDNIVHLWPDVRADLGEMTVSSEKAAYIGGDNYILLENNVVFNGRGIIVTSSEAGITLDEDLIVATGDVHTRLP